MKNKAEVKEYFGFLVEELDNVPLLQENEELTVTGMNHLINSIDYIKALVQMIAEDLYGEDIE